VPLSASTRLGPYEIISAIGAGGMGEVYRARDPRLNRDVAVKILRADTSDNPERRARFEREARAVALLNHPNIVAIFDFGEESGIQYTVSELVVGESLRALLRHGALPTRRLLDIAVQIADGLAAAHSAGIAHRDLKPENIMITEDGRAKILDFGLARQTDPTARGESDGLSTLSAHMTQPGTVLGTANYMSPEQARGGSIDYRSDQFSFGLILYELASGKRAFSKESAVEILAAIVKEEPAALDAKLPPPLRWIIDRCLIKDPRQRYESTRDLHHELSALRDHLSDTFSSTPIEPVKSARMPGHLWKWIAIPACIVSIVSVAATSALLTRNVGVDLSRHRHTPFAINPEVQQQPVWSPDGKAVAYAGMVNGHDQVFVRYLDSPVPKQLATNREYARPTRWSLDCKRILFFAPGLDSTEAQPTRALFSIAVVGGEPEHLTATPKEQFSGRDEISPDGQTLAFFGRLKKGEPMGVFISSPPGSPYRQYEPAPFASKIVINSTTMRFSPDGKKLLLTRTGDSSTEEAWLLPFPPGKSAPHLVFKHFPPQRRVLDLSWMADNRHVALAIRYWGSSAKAHIWIADTESDDSYQITEGTDAQSSVAVSPNSKQVVYSESRFDLDIVSVSLSDGRPTKLIASDVPERMAAWAAKTNKLAYVTNRNGPMEIWVRSAEGSDQPLVTQKSFPANASRNFTNPALSPDGERIVFTRQSSEGQVRTWILSSSVGAPERLNESATGNEYAGTWSPDGSRFAELESANTFTSLTVIKVGSRERPVVLRERVWILVPDWSPTGEWLTFRDESGWNLISPNGAKVKPLGRITSQHLSFSRDGKLLYGIRQEQDRTTLFSLDVATLKVTDIRELGRDLAPASDYSPGVRFSLTPDGKSITYSTATYKSNLWLLEGFRQPGLLSRLGLNLWDR
jgi:eukaryotic-like serine/threonine-protein kinase